RDDFLGLRWARVARMLCPQKSRAASVAGCRRGRQKSLRLLCAIPYRPQSECACRLRSAPASNDARSIQLPPQCRIARLRIFRKAITREQANAHDVKVIRRDYIQPKQG